MANDDVEMIIAYLHSLDSHGRYAVSIDGERIVTNSRDPECDLARALAARGITGHGQAARRQHRQSSLHGQHREGGEAERTRE